MRNPFRHPTRKAAYAKAIECYRARHRDLFRTDGSRADGSSPPVWFWRGYDGAGGERWKGDDKEMTAYAFWRAGQDARKYEPLAAPSST